MCAIGTAVEAVNFEPGDVIVSGIWSGCKIVDNMPSAFGRRIGYRSPGSDFIHSFHTASESTFTIVRK